MTTSQFVLTVLAGAGVAAIAFVLAILIGRWLGSDTRSRTKIGFSVVLAVTIAGGFAVALMAAALIS